MKNNIAQAMDLINWTLTKYSVSHIQEPKSRHLNIYNNRKKKKIGFITIKSN